MTVDDERQVLAEFLAFYDEHPPNPEWKEAVTEVRGRALFG